MFQQFDFTTIAEFFNTPAGHFLLLVISFFALSGAYLVGRKALNAIGLIALPMPLAKIYELLEPQLTQAVAAAYKASEWIADETGTRLHGLDKKQIAKKAYDLLPDELAVGPFRIKWKTRVTLVDFEILVQTAFDNLTRLWDENSRLYLEDLKRIADDMKDERVTTQARPPKAKRRRH